MSRVNTTPEAACQTPPTRDRGGRFLPGNPGGPGNPFGRHVAQLRKALFDEIGEDRFRSLANRMFELAMEGDHAAGKLLFQYLLGRPAEVANPDRVDADEWRLIKEAFVPVKVWERTLSGIPAEAANDLAQGLRPAKAEGFTEYVDETLRHKAEAEAAEAEEEAADAEAEAAEREEDARKAAAAPSCNGSNGALRPSTNGRNGHAPAKDRPSTNGRSEPQEPATPSAVDDDACGWLTEILEQLQARGQRPRDV